MKPNPLMIVFAVLAVSFFGRAIHFAGAAAESLNAPGDSAAADVGRAKNIIADQAEHKTQPQAAAAEEKAKPAAKPADPAPTPTPAPETAAAAAPSGDQSELEPLDASVDRSVLLAKIRARSAALDRREAELADRASLLEVVEKRIDEKTAALKAVKEELETRLSFADTAAKDDIARLAKMYENMKPKKAGEIFDAMDPTFAAGFLTEMKSESAALILANMETKKAYAASVIIAGRNANINR